MTPEKERVMMRSIGLPTLLIIVGLIVGLVFGLRALFQK
jgi:predicted membrane metal-binding protein